MTGPHAVSRMLPTRRAAVTVPAPEQREALPPHLGIPATGLTLSATV
jgi:hypothetical protein